MTWTLPLFLLRACLAAFFALLAYRALSSDATTAADFARWGYPPGFLFFTGVCQAVGAVLLLLPATTPYGGALLGAVLVGATLTHLRHDPISASLSPMLVGVALLAALSPWLRRLLA